MCYSNAEKRQAFFYLPKSWDGHCVQNSQIYYIEAQGKEIARLVKNIIVIIYSPTGIMHERPNALSRWLCHQSRGHL